MIAKIISGVPDNMSGRPLALCRTFWTPVRHFPSWWLANISGHSCFPCRTFYVYWTMLDKMFGNFLAPCRTLAELSRTCPAYFAITGPPPKDDHLRWSSGWLILTLNSPFLTTSIVLDFRKWPCVYENVMSGALHNAPWLQTHKQISWTGIGHTNFHIL